MVALHLLVTSLCDRDCKYCCNKEYDIHNLPYVTDDELRSAGRLYITGGEPFLYSSPCDLANYYRHKYPNISSVVVYTNAAELLEFLECGGFFHNIDGLDISIKNEKDIQAWNEFLSKDYKVRELPKNRIYDFTGTISDPEIQVVQRRWQEHFVPAPNSIFRRGN